MVSLVFGKQEIEGFCPKCGLPLKLGVCIKVHKIKNPKRKNPDFSGKSNSVNKYNEYNE